MGVDTTKFVAIYGALVSTFAVGWNVYRDFHDRPRLKLSVMLGHRFKDGDRVSIIARSFAMERWPERFKHSAPGIFVTFTNTGRRPVAVQGWAIRANRKKTGNDNFIYRLTVLPKSLKEGEYAVESAEDIPLLKDGATAIYAWDTAGTKWFLPRSEFRRIRKEATNLAIEASAGKGHHAQDKS